MRTAVSILLCSDSEMVLRAIMRMIMSPLCAFWSCSVQGPMSEKP